MKEIQREKPKGFCWEILMRLMKGLVMKMETQMHLGTDLVIQKDFPTDFYLEKGSETYWGKEMDFLKDLHLETYSGLKMLTLA